MKMAKPNGPAKPGDNSNSALKAFVERIERLEDEKKALVEDIRGVFAEAKGQGFDLPALREVIRLRKKDRAELTEHEAIVETYRAALGMTPLDRAFAEAQAQSKSGEG